MRIVDLLSENSIELGASIASKPMGVSTYKTAKEMSEELRRALPDVNELRKLLENETME